MAVKLSIREFHRTPGVRQLKSEIQAGSGNSEGDPRWVAFKMHFQDYPQDRQTAVFEEKQANTCNFILSSKQVSQRGYKAINIHARCEQRMLLHSDHSKRRG